MADRLSLSARFVGLAASAATFAALPAIHGCAKHGSELQAGFYRATVTLPGDREVPFGLEAAQAADGIEVYVVSGESRVRLENVRAEPGRLTANVPGDGGTLAASISGGDLDGTFTLAAAAGAKQVALPFAAEFGKTHRFFEEPLSDNADVAGRWAVTVTDDKRRTTRAVAVFRQTFEQVNGELTVAGRAPQPLSGEVRDENLLLSHFDGSRAVLLHAKLDAKGTLTGETWSARGAHGRLVAKRDPNASLETAATSSPAPGGAGSLPAP
jgi:hypothetical protein